MSTSHRQVEHTLFVIVINRGVLTLECFVNKELPGNNVRAGSGSGSRSEEY